MRDRSGDVARTAQLATVGSIGGECGWMVHNALEQRPVVEWVVD